MNTALQKRILLMLAAACTIIPSGAEAAYSADGETGMQHLDFIENRRREARANALTPEQEKLLADVRAMQSICAIHRICRSLRRSPLRATTSPMTRARVRSRRRDTWTSCR